MGKVSASLFIEQKIREQLESDGFIIDDINVDRSTLTDFKINLEAHK